jgi:hypothetical protein
MGLVKTLDRERMGGGDPRHFLDIDEIAPSTLRGILAESRDFKALRRSPDHPKPLAGKTLAMIFEKPSTRTRVSFEVAMRQLGGDVIILTANDMRHGARAIALCRRDYDAHGIGTEADGVGAPRHGAGDQRPDRPQSPMPDHGRHHDL